MSKQAKQNTVRARVKRLGFSQLDEAGRLRSVPVGTVVTVSTPVSAGRLHYLDVLDGKPELEAGVAKDNDKPPTQTKEPKQAKEPTANDLIAIINESDDTERVSEFLADERKTVREAAENRLEALKEAESE